MAKLRKLINKYTDAAVEQIARYYKNSRPYLHESNSTDAYQFYIDTYTKDTDVIGSIWIYSKTSISEGDKYA